MGRRRFAEPEPSGPIDTLRGATAVAELDLHGETADSGRQRVDWFLDRWGRQRPGAVVRIITGRGHRSEDGKAVLAPLVRRMLDENASALVREWTTDVGGGSFLVRVGAPGI